MVEGLLKTEEPKGESGFRPPKVTLKRLTRPEIRNVFEKGRKVLSSAFVLFFIESRASTPPSYSIQVKKKLGTAAERNRTKRIFREALQRHKLLLKGYQLILIPRSDSKGIGLNDAVDQVMKIFLGMQRKK
ncbi:MAG: ribonuclease P protein component [Nitrospirae bacterium]|nr:ribonuclease P protein component [Candidatus Manganitrophaceae bacterium]